MPVQGTPLQQFTGETVLALAFMAVSTVLVADNRTVGARPRQVFLTCIVSVALITMADWFNVVVTPGNPRLHWFHVVSQALTFAVAPTFPVVIAQTIFPERHVRWVFGILSLQALLEVATIFGGFVFWVGPDNAYHRGPLYGAYMLSYAIAALYLSFESIKAGRRYQSVNTLSVVSILLFLAVGVGMQVANSSVRTSWPAVGMVLLLYFQFYAEMILRTDALTRLLNRHSYEERLSRGRGVSCVVVIDVDNFKRVNDTHGHAYGDEALVTMAGLILRAFGSVGQCFRTGGDEFSVMVTRQRADVARCARTLDGLVAEAIAADPRLPTVSWGMAEVGDGGFAAAVETADANMYEAKRARRAATSPPPALPVR